jgi:lipid A disaccharide synthetase
VRSEETTARAPQASNASRLTPHASPNPIAIVAGEASGDLLGSLLIRSVQGAGMEADFYGIAGPKMQSAGARSLYPQETLAVRGYVEALGSLSKILAIRRDLKKRLQIGRASCRERVS